MSHSVPTVQPLLGLAQALYTTHVIGYHWTFGRMSTVLDVVLTQVYAQEYGSTFRPDQGPASSVGPARSSS